jgi:hypothetical protein
MPEFAIRITMKAEDPITPGQLRDIVMEFGAAEKDMVIARNPSLPYLFKVNKEILEKLPGKIADIAEENPQTAAAKK